MLDFKGNPAVRFWARALLAAAIAGLAVAATIWIDNAYVRVSSAVVGALAAYLGIGATTPVEPFVGANKVDVEVPADKATIIRARPEATA